MTVCSLLAEENNGNRWKILWGGAITLPPPYTLSRFGGWFGFGCFFFNEMGRSWLEY